METLSSFLAGVRSTTTETLTPFCGGVVGFFGYEMANSGKTSFTTNPGKGCPL
jgi:hypothetical protein